MNRQHFPSPKRLLTWYREGTITREQWLAGMRQQFLLALQEIEEDRRDPHRAILETWRCKAAARRLLKENTETELREVFVALGEMDDFPPSTYLWNADQTDIPLHCFLRERREPILRFRKMRIGRLSADLIIEYGDKKSKERLRIRLRRDWRGILVVEFQGND